VKRLAFPVVFVLGFVLAGGLSAAVVASTTGSTSTGTTTAPTETTPTTAPAPDVIPPGVSIAGVSVGTLSSAQAYAAVQQVFSRPLSLVVARHRLAPTPTQLGAVARIKAAVEKAKKATPGADVPLVVTVQRTRIRSYLATVAKRFDRAPVDAKLSLRKLRPWISKDVPGLRLDRKRSEAAIAGALIGSSRALLRLPTKAIAPAVTRKGWGPVIVIRRGQNRLYLYRGMRLQHTFGVATGQRIYPTPLGRFDVVVKWRNPWWYPPNSPWAKGQKPIPPGPGNPLGTRWMGLSSPGVGIHGTPDDASIGYSVSHGCIRMHIRDAEWLFNHVTVGTTVFIVAA
jgi:lipoprotein-anchoring transpeptidase ErfK/SrfK